MKFKINLELKFVIFLFFAVLVGIFAIQNAETVMIKFLWAKFSISQAIIILGSVLAGALMVVILGTIKQLKQNKLIKDLKEQVKSLSEEMDKLLELSKKDIIGEALEEGEEIKENEEENTY